MSTRPYPFALAAVSVCLTFSAPIARAESTPASSPTTAATPQQPTEAAKLAADVVKGAEAAKAEEPARTPKAKEASSRDTLSVDFPDEDIRNILRNVSDLFELNIIMPETLQGKTTIKLRDVTWRQIFQNVLEPVGYTFVEDGNIIKIVSKENLNEEPVTTEVFIINYARAADILPTISSLVDATKGKIVVDARSNSLVITERPTRLSRIRPIINQLDRATDQVMIESKFVEISNTDVKNIGVNWSSLSGYTVTAGNLTNSYNRSQGSTSNTGSSGNNTTVVSGNQTASTGSATSVAVTQSTTAGASSSVGSVNGTVTSSSNTGTSSATGGNSTTTDSSSTGTTAGTATSNASGFFNDIAFNGSTAREVTALFSADDFKVVLSALQTQTDVKVVSNPTIVTLNNTEATINVGDSQPIPNYAFNQQTGSFEVNGFNYKDIGIILKVTPQVNARGFIKLTLSPEVSQQNGTRKFGTAELPIIAMRKAVTQVSLKDGYTMGIGGLLSTQTTKGETKVPVLGSIPVIGRLFRSESKNLQTTNLIIFITAKTVSADGAPVEQVFDSGRVRQLDMHKEDLPGYRDGSSPWVVDPEPAKKKADKKSTKSDDKNQTTTSGS